MVSRLYAVLELGNGENSSESEIKAAFHRLALRYHPAGPNAAAKFKEISSAYRILSDPQLRAVYDQYGERGLDYAETPLGNAAMSFFGVRFLLTILLVFAVIAAASLITFLSLLAVKVDSGVGIPWSALFSPLFLLSSLLVLGWIGVAKSGIEWFQHTVASAGYAEAIVMPFNLGMMLGYILAPVAIDIGLEYTASGKVVDWVLQLTPLIVSEAFRLITRCLQSTPEKVNSRLEKLGFSTVPTTVLYVFLALDLAESLCVFLFTVLIPVRLTGKYLAGASWVAIGTPFYLFSAVHLTNLIINVMLLRQRIDAGVAATVLMIVPTVAVEGLLLAGGALVLVKAQGSPIPLKYCFIPFFILLVVLLLCGSCCGVVSCLAPVEAFEIPHRATTRAPPTEDSMAEPPAVAPSMESRTRDVQQGFHREDTCDSGDLFSLKSFSDSEPGCNDV